MIKKFIIFLIIVLLSACSIAPKPRTTVVNYDFGLQLFQQTSPTDEQSQLEVRSILVADIESAPGFDNQNIHYRLAYSNPTQNHTYANSRWVATPAVLLTQKLRSKIIQRTNHQIIKNNSTAISDYALHIELEEFIQVFDTKDTSHTIISLRASLVERKPHALLAQQTFSIKQNASSANAEGAVDALATASDMLIDEIVDWLTKALSTKQTPPS